MYRQIILLDGSTDFYREDNYSVTQSPQPLQPLQPPQPLQPLQPLQNQHNMT